MVVSYEPVDQLGLLLMARATDGRGTASGWRKPPSAVPLAARSPEKGPAPAPHTRLFPYAIEAPLWRPLSKKGNIITNTKLFASAVELIRAAQVALDYLTDHAIDLDGEPEEILAGIRIDLADAITEARRSAE